jgi:hypothetical protein
MMFNFFGEVPGLLPVAVIAVIGSSPVSALELVERLHPHLG